jgi:uncharacterized iron-regulated membrane protein
MKPNSLRRLHRWTGLACALGLLMASSSGILHVVMTWTQSAPPPAHPAEAIKGADLQVTPAEALERLGGEPASSVSLRMIGGEPWWQVLSAGSPVPAYISARDGREDTDRDAAYAAEIAGRYIGPGATVRWTRRLDAYDREYIPIFRLLPVHLIDVDDGKGTRLYVSTLTGSVARHTDDRRQLEANLFSILHKYQFIPIKAWRDGLLVAVTTTMFATALGGVILFFLTRKRSLA